MESTRKEDGEGDVGRTTLNEREEGNKEIGEGRGKGRGRSERSEEEGFVRQIKRARVDDEVRKEGMRNCLI